MANLSQTDRRFEAYERPESSSGVLGVIKSVKDKIGSVFSSVKIAAVSAAIASASLTSCGVDDDRAQDGVEHVQKTLSLTGHTVVEENGKRTIHITFSGNAFDDVNFDGRFDNGDEAAIKAPEWGTDRVLLSAEIPEGVETLFLSSEGEGINESYVFEVGETAQEEAQEGASSKLKNPADYM